MTTAVLVTSVVEVDCCEDSLVCTDDDSSEVTGVVREEVEETVEVSVVGI